VDASGNLTAANFKPDDYLTDASQFAPASHTHPLSALTQSSATTGQVATWNGTAWVPTTPASGGGGSATTDASLLTSGTLDDARLSSNVSLDNINNSFTAGQAIAAPANTSALTASYSVTGANTTPLLDLSGTWNTTGVANGIRLNLTDTGSAASSVLFDFRVGNSRRCSIRKDGSFNFDTRDDASFTGIGLSNGGIGASVQISTGLAGRFLVSNGLVNMPSSQLFGWVSGTGLQNFPDVALARDAANTLAQRNSTNAQTFRLYGTFTDASNGRRLDITSTTAGIFTLTATGNGTGASGNLLKLTAPILLPASSVTLATNGDLAFEATSNTTLTIRYRGSDGTTRSAAITLA
jgi:hypothetical protein